MIRIYADGYLVNDSRLEAHDLVGLTVTHGLNTSGTAEIVMPVEHPAYDAFVGYRTLVTIQRDGELRFRGRALYHADNFYGQRTVTCEGEMGFLRDSVQRPYSFEDTPANILKALLKTHNSQLEAYKHFTLGEVTVSTETVKLENDSAETVLSVLNKLIDECGGFVVFTSAEDGSRVLNLYAAINRKSSQTVELGENLLDFSATGANNKSLATGLIPYGARDNTTEQRLTIESVNDGKDYIIAEDAKDVRSIIMTTQTWDDVTDATILLQKARAYLNESKTFVSSLELTALDLSYIDKTLDSFTVGDLVRVKSHPHGVDEDFQLTKLTENLLNPSKSKITLGKDVQYLTGADATSERKTQNALSSVKTDYNSMEASVLKQAAVADQSILDRLITEEESRKALIDLLWEAVYVGGGARNTYVNGLELHLGDDDHPTHIYSSDNVKFHKGATFEASSADFGNANGIRIAAADGSMYYVLRVDADDKCHVGNDYATLYLRSKGSVYLQKTGATVTSDRREKNSIEPLPEAYEAVLDKLTPVRFKYNGKGDQYHVGFVAQDVEQALADAGLEREDFGGFVDLNGDGTELGLAYDEFIGLLLHKIRKLEKRIEKMEG